MKKIIILFALIPLITFGQTRSEERKKNRANEVGEFEFGMRSTVSLLDSYSFPGLGYGGQFRIRAGKRINTEWYSDYIRTDMAGLGNRETVHIGWSVMIYPFKTETVKGNFTPYFIAGNCFDYGRVTSNKYLLANNEIATKQTATRVSTAVQVGLGCNYFLTNKFNLSFSVQYMDHIGKDLHAEIRDKNDNAVHSRSHFKDEGNYLHIGVHESSKDLVLAGHLLVNLSLNIKLFDLAK